MLATGGAPVALLEVAKKLLLVVGGAGTVKLGIEGGVGVNAAASGFKDGTEVCGPTLGDCFEDAPFVIEVVLPSDTDGSDPPRGGAEARGEENKGLVLNAEVPNGLEPNIGAG